jgi:hypothetical protein
MDRFHPHSPLLVYLEAVPMATHSLARMEVSPATYREVKSLLLQAGYHHAISSDGSGRERLDMTGIALQLRPDRENQFVTNGQINEQHDSSSGMD